MPRVNPWKPRHIIKNRFNILRGTKLIGHWKLKVEDIFLKLRDQIQTLRWLLTISNHLLAWINVLYCWTERVGENWVCTRGHYFLSSTRLVILYSSKISCGTVYKSGEMVNTKLLHERYLLDNSGTIVNPVAVSHLLLHMDGAICSIVQQSCNRYHVHSSSLVNKQLEVLATRQRKGIFCCRICLY